MFIYKLNFQQGLLKIFFLMGLITLSLACTTASNSEQAKQSPQLEKGEDVKQNLADIMKNYELIAVSELSPKSGSQAQGVVEFRTHPQGLLISIQVSNVETTGLHGIHIHEFGDCSAEDASSAGDHYNPTGEKHGRPNSEVYHFGDLGNITINERGEGQKVLILQKPRQPGLSDFMIFNRSVILHAQADHFTQPSGDSGVRIACGVISQV